MSFDLTLWCRSDHLPDMASMHRWLMADRRFTAVGEVLPRGFTALTTCGGGPYASMDVEDVGDLDEDDFGAGPAGYRPAGIRFEISYSTPDAVATELLALIGVVADRFGCVVNDQQIDSDEPSDIGALIERWQVASAQAREIFARHQQQRRSPS